MGVPVDPDPGVCLKTGVAVGIEGQGDAAAPEQVLHQQEVVVAVFLRAKQGVDHGAGGVVHRDQQRERRGLIPQPRVIAAVQLDQHALLGHPLPTDSVFGWTAAPGTAQSNVQQDPPQGGPADVNAFPLGQQFREVGVVDASVPGPSQLRHVDDQRLGRGIDGSATAVAMCQSRRAAFTVGRQDAAGVTGSGLAQK